MGSVMDLSAIASSVGWSPPDRFDLAKKADRNRLESLLASDKVQWRHDPINVLVEELYHYAYPNYIDKPLNEHFTAFKKLLIHDSPDEYGEWYYFSWSKSLVHFPPAEDLFKLLTSRNRNLITDEEQKRLADATILIAGLSVGSNVADYLLLQGIGCRLILADNDVLSATNLNRIKAPYTAIGFHKVDVAAQKISERNPYIEQIHLKEGLSEQNLSKILRESKPDIIVEEMDQLRMKVVVREYARKAGIPVISAADDGDGILLDIERYDQHSDLPLLHGLLPHWLINDFLEGREFSRPELGALIGKYFVGFEHVPIRMFESLAQVGKTLPSWPQLGGAAGLAGICLSYCCKRILLEQPLKSGRFVISPDLTLNPEMESDTYAAQLAAIRAPIESYINSVLERAQAQKAEAA